jgi:hypothetical protein
LCKKSLSNWIKANLIWHHHVKIHFLVSFVSFSFVWINSLFKDRFQNTICINIALSELQIWSLKKLVVLPPIYTWCQHVAPDSSTFKNRRCFYGGMKIQAKLLSDSKCWYLVLIDEIYESSAYFVNINGISLWLTDKKKCGFGWDCFILICECFKWFTLAFLFVSWQKQVIHISPFFLFFCSFWWNWKANELKNILSLIYLPKHW